MIDENEILKYTSSVRSELEVYEDSKEEEVRSEIARIIYRETAEENFSLKDRETLVKNVFDSIRKLDVLQELIEDEEISEIMVNGYDHIFIEKKGTIYEWNKRF